MLGEPITTDLLAGSALIIGGVGCAAWPATAMILHAIEAGQGDPPLVLLHGLFGSARNFGTVQREFAQRRRTIALDLRNHGASPHARRHALRDHGGRCAANAGSARAHAGDAARAIRWAARSAMQAALAQPDAVARLIVADIAPVPYPPHLRATAAAMAALPLVAGHDAGAGRCGTGRRVPDAAMRAFLLQNLQPGASPAWRIGLAEIVAGFADIEAWDAPADARYAGPTLFIAGATSNYIRPEHRPAIRALFPRARFVTLKNAGHWLHADNPAGFVAGGRGVFDSADCAERPHHRAMRLTDEESAMLAGEAGAARQWAIEHQIRVGRYLGAADFVPVSQAHIMADTESLGAAGVEWLERLAALPEDRAPRAHPHHHRPARHRLRRGGAAEAAGLDAGAGTPRHRRVRGTRRADDRHLHQLPDDHAGSARRAHGVWRHRRGDLLEQRAGRAVEFRGRAVGAGRRADRPHAALWLSSGGKAPRHAAAARRRTRRASCTNGARWAASSGGIAGDYWQVPALVGIDRVPTLG